MAVEPRAVLDTNVFVSGFINPHGFPAAIFRALRSKRFILVSSPPVNEESVAWTAATAVRGFPGGRVYCRGDGQILVRGSDGKFERSIIIPQRLFCSSALMREYSKKYRSERKGRRSPIPDGTGRSLDMPLKYVKGARIATEGTRTAETAVRATRF